MDRNADLTHAPRSTYSLSIWLILISAIFVLSACTNNNLGDLEAYIEETRKNQQGHVEPLPQFKPFETFTYAAVNLRDPFTPWHDVEDNTQHSTQGDGLKPDFERHKELLEKYPLDSLRMVGTLAKDGSNWAIIKGPDSMVYRVKEGNFLGQNHGKIQLLAEDKIVLMELVPDGIGGWLEREAALSLVE